MHRPNMEQTLRHLALIPLLSSALALAQVPNGSFEQWTDFGDYQDPTGWTSLNIMSSFAGADPSCMMGSPGAVGDHHVVLVCREVPEFGVMPGLLLSGDPNAGTEGYPFTGRPEALTGQWRFSPVGIDLGAINITLSRWDPGSNERVTIGYGDAGVVDLIEEWETFTATIQYLSEEIPDTATISIVTGTGGNPGTTLWVDDLAFTTFTAVDEQVRVPALALYPSPAVEQLHVNCEVEMREVQVLDATGRIVLSRSVSATTLALDVRSMPAGVYHLRMMPRTGPPAYRSFVKG